MMCDGFSYFLKCVRKNCVVYSELLHPYFTPKVYMLEFDSNHVQAMRGVEMKRKKWNSLFTEEVLR